MGWLSVIIGVIATVIFWSLGNYILLALSIVSTIGVFWSLGIMHNYATEKAKTRSSYSGKFYDFTDRELDSVPSWITFVNMLMTLFSLVLLIISIVMKIIK